MPNPTEGRRRPPLQAPTYQRQKRVELGLPKKGRRLELPYTVTQKIERAAKALDRLDNDLGQLWDRELVLMGEEADDHLRQLRQQSLAVRRQMVILKGLTTNARIDSG